jgi:GNAT superfamily N-acetyltransferase
VTPLRDNLIEPVMDLLALGKPYVRPRTYSDYWAYAHLFGSTCPVALTDTTVVGVVIAFRSQDDPEDVYVQDVMTHPDYRKQGIARRLLDTVQARASDWGCRRLYLTSEPDNNAAHTTWRSLGFTNVPGDHTINGVSVISDYKGPRRHRAVYELRLA